MFFHIYVSSFPLLMNRITYSTSYFFSTMNTLQYQFIVSILLFSFLKQLATLSLVPKETNEQNQVSISQYIYFGSFQIHQLIIIYCFESTNHNICLRVFHFKVFRNSLHDGSLYQSCIPYLRY